MKKKIILIIFILLALLFVFSFSNKGEADVVTFDNNSSTIFIDIKGAVNSPGVYELDKNKRLIDAIDVAGGLTDEADTSLLNLSKKLKDEMYIIIYTKEIVNKYKEENVPKTKIIQEIEEKILCPDSDNDACIKKENSIKGLININNASKEELMTIPGIGESKASKIIEYRKDNKFETTSDITKVDGISNSIYEKIKDLIEV